MFNERFNRIITTQKDIQHVQRKVQEYSTLYRTHMRTATFVCIVTPPPYTVTS